MFKKRKAYLKKILITIVILVWLGLSFKVASFSIFHLNCVVISDICFLILWGLMKYSDYYYWNAPPSEKFVRISSKEYSEECKFLNVIVDIDNISDKQEVWIENIQRSKILYVEGYLEFYSHNNKIYEIHFMQQNIVSGKRVKIDKISADLVQDYFENISWNEVYLNIEKIRSEDGREERWEGTIIYLLRILDIEPIRYFRLGLWRILPYELSWLYDNVIERAQRLRRIAFDVAVLKNKSNNIGYVRFLGKVFRQSLGWILLFIIICVCIIMIVGQFLIIRQFLDEVKYFVSV